MQQRMALNKKAPAKGKAAKEYLLTTKLFCGTCGRLMVGESGKSRTGVMYYYYKCGGAKRHLGCKRKAIRKQWIERAAVLMTIQRVLRDDEISRIADAIVSLQEREDTTLPAMRSQLAACEKAIDNMLNAIQMGIINASTKQRLDELEERKKDIELQIIQEEMKHPAVSREDVIYFVCRFRSLDTSKLDARRRLIDSFVNAVIIFDDYILITFNYKEGETRIDFADIESSDLQSVGGP